jgi:hypothetical protein
MGIFTKKNHGREYDYALIGKKQFFLAPKGELSSKPDNVLAALEYAKEYYGDTIELESRLISYLPQPEKDRYITQLLNRLEKQFEESFASLSDSGKKQYLEYKPSRDQTRRRPEAREIIDEVMIANALNSPTTEEIEDEAKKTEKKGKRNVG